jgi:glutaminyl-peptide cyclotransferase
MSFHFRIRGGAGIVVLVLSIFLTGCARTPTSAASEAPPPARYSYSVVNTYPHDPEAYTQGLIYRDGMLFESTGLNGQSTLRKVRLESGEVIQRVDIDDRYFAEGLADWNGSLIQLTWQSGTGFVYDLTTFGLRRQFTYTGEGWGLTRDDTRLIMSDGTPTLRFLNPETLAETGRITVTERGLPVEDINELEMVRGELLANIYQSNDVVVISPATGAVTARIDFGALRSRLKVTRPVDVFNGIAYDPVGDRLFVTGKWWPSLFEVKLIRN